VLDRIPGAALVAAIAAVVLALGTFTALRYPVWSGDESAHFDYVRSVAERHRLPTLEEPTSDATLAIAEGTYPNGPTKPAAQWGLAGTVYEAFQPPLYYLVVAPVFLVAGAYDTKVDVLRLVGLGLFLVALGLFAVLCRDVARRRWRAAFAFGALFFVLPGNVVRAVSVGNEALDVPLGVLATLVLWRALDRDSDGWSLAAAVVVGAGILTKFTFIAFLPVLAAVLAVRWSTERTRGRALQLGALIALPVLMLSPWLVWNHRHYGTWTANGQAREAQAPIINPTHQDYALNKVVNEAHLALDATIMQGWETVGHQDVPSYLKWSLLTVLYVVPLLMLTARAPVIEWHRRLVLGAPLVVTFAMLAYITVVENWGVMIFRYVRPAMPAWFLFAFLLDRSEHSPAVITRITLAAAVGLAVLWWADARMYLV
jgi:4-amino-4-deoxy-L-arabinose transferase-like glycosyltransferase